MTESTSTTHKLTISVVLDKAARIPERATYGAIGYDLRSTISTMIMPKERLLVPTGISIELPDGIAGMVLPRSGLALRHGVTCLNTPGLIDPDYRGQIGVLLLNTGDSPFQIMQGDRIAQLVFVPCFLPMLVSVPTLSETDRHTGGWGSTGVTEKGLNLIRE